MGRFVKDQRCAFAAVLLEEAAALSAARRREPGEEMLRALLLTVNAIGMGQKMTG